MALQYSFYLASGQVCEYNILQLNYHSNLQLTRVPMPPENPRKRDLS